jgi:hypothetical protein
MSEMPSDPFGPPEELVTLMKGLTNLYNAAILAGLPVDVATNFITGVFVSLSHQNAPETQQE